MASPEVPGSIPIVLQEYRAHRVLSRSFCHGAFFGRSEQGIPRTGIPSVFRPRLIVFKTSYQLIRFIQNLLHCTGHCVYLTNLGRTFIA
ncbi:MAG: hypothetical protein ACYCZY_01470 [Lacisediminihabitans sp.]